ncbi:hypothetical protein JXC34_00095 [Candidatus Woesearchaeota archaeon]|nr:hypothetical protein [Candidatus Woesearchaeota archaeon]
MVKTDDNNIRPNSFVVVLLEEVDYNSRVVSFLKSLTKEHKKICYVLFQATYDEISDAFRKNELALERFHFIDVLSLFMGHKKNTRNCSYIKGADIPSLLNQLRRIIEKERCTLILFDNIGSLLSFYHGFEIQKFTNILKTDRQYSTAKKMYLLQLPNEKINEKSIQEENNNLINDLRLFADNMLNLANL